METIFGKIFKELREERGYLIKELSNPSISSSTISRFENGFNNISIDKFFYLLKSIQILPEEFFARYETEVGIPFIQATAALSESFNSSNRLIYEQLLEEIEKTISQVSDSKTFELQAISIKAVINFYDSSYQISQRELDTVKFHLLDTPVWQTFELILYLRLSSSFDNQSLKEVSDQLFISALYDSKISEYLHALYVAFINLTNQMGQREMFDYFPRVIRFLASHKIPERFGLEKGFINFNIGAYHYKTGKIEQGTKEMERVIQAFTYLDLLVQANLMANELNDLKNSNKKTSK